MRNLSLQLVVALAIFALEPLPAMVQEPSEKASADETINYLVDLTDSLRHYITVTADIPADGETTTLMMAVWTPGSYLVREYPKHVVDLVAFDRRGNELPVTKTTKNRWVVSDTEKQKRIRVQYRVYCRDSTVRTNWVDDRYAMLNGGPTFITRADKLDSPATVQLQMAEGWKRSATSLMPDGETAHRYRAESYHELVDSPIVAGNIEVFPFQASGVTHALVNVNDMGFWDGSRAVRDLAKLVEAQHKMWGLVPYDRYLFINVIKGSGGGGLEHNNCCLLESGQFDCTNEGSYRSFLSLCSHEFFHAWNVRRLRPSELAKYDYEQENYTPSLWVAEGITTYYQDLMLARAGFTDDSDMIGDLSGLVTSVQMTPGRLKQSLRDSSHDAWIKYYRPEENSRYNEISYYSKGAVVAWLLDAEIRMATEGRKSLDDVMRTLYAKYANGPGYSAGDFRDVCSEIAGKDLAAFFERSVNSTDELDYQTAATWFGLDIGPFKPLDESKQADVEVAETGDASNAAEPAAAPASRPGRGGRAVRGQAWLGFSTRSTNGQSIVNSVTPDSPADLAGISLDDEVIALEGMRVKGDVESLLRLYSVGETVKLMIAREQRIIEIPIEISTRDFSFWSLTESGDDNRERRKRRELWIHGEVPQEPDPSKSSDKQKSDNDL